MSSLRVLLCSCGAEEENVHSLGSFFGRRGHTHDALNRELNVPKGENSYEC